MTSNHAAAAKMIRQQLKAHGIAATVRTKSYSGGSSITVSVQDQAPWTVKAIEAYARQFQRGHFDGMTDCYEYSNRRDDLPQVTFVFVQNEFSPATYQAAWDYLRGYMLGFDKLPADYAEAAQLRIRWTNDRVVDEVHRALVGRLGKFWPKPHLRLAS